MTNAMARIGIHDPDLVDRPLHTHTWAHFAPTIEELQGLRLGANIPDPSY